MNEVINGELGSSVRNKLNLLITKYNSTVSVRNIFELNELPDGTRTLFTASKIFLAGTADVYANRLKQYKGTGVGFDYTEASANSIEFAVAPETGVVLVLEAVENTNTEKIVFVDSAVKALCATNWGSGGEITYAQAATVTDLNGVFDYWADTPPTEQITSFNELQYFTGLTNLGESPEGNGQFSGAEQLVEITLPPNLVTLGDYAFKSCSGLTSITIPNSVTSISASAFQRCTGLTSVTISNSVTSIGIYAFSECTGLTSITIPNSVTLIGSNVFEGCSGLTSITIPNSVTSIGDYAFAVCSSLISINITSVTPPTLGADTFLNNTNLSHIYVPNASVDAYKAAAGWSAYADIITAIDV